MAPTFASAQRQLKPATGDSARAVVVVWPEVTTLRDSGRTVDVAYSASGLNIVNPVEMAWCADAAAGELIAVASKPIAGTAAAGEEMGRRGRGLIKDPVALHVTPTGQFVLGAGGRLAILRSGWTDTLDLAPTRLPARDIAVSGPGLIYVLLENEIRVYADPPRDKPLWTIRVPPKLAPPVAIAVSARGEVYLAGRGTLGVAVFELDNTGTFKLVRSRSARELGVDRMAGMALAPQLLVPLPGREGWAGPDRFLVLSDAGRAGLVALEGATLAPAGRIDLASEMPGAVPGRIDISNRAQIAVADPESGRAYALPARLFARLIEGSKIRWRKLAPDSTATAGAGP